MFGLVLLRKSAIMKRIWSMLELHLSKFDERHGGVGEPLAIIACGSPSQFVNPFCSR